MVNFRNISITDLRLGATQVKAAYFGSKQVWGGEEPGPTAIPLCFTAEGNNASVAVKHGTSAPQISLQTSTDNVNWINYTLDTTITLANTGDKVYFKAQDVNERTGDGMSGWQSAYNNYFDCSNVSVSGKLVSILRQDMDDTKVQPVDGMLTGLMRNFNSRNPQIISAKDLVLPQLSSYPEKTFYGTFANSTLSAIPAFPTYCNMAGQDVFGWYLEKCANLSSIDSPMMTINGIYAHALTHMFMGTKLNQSELKLIVEDIYDFPTNAFTYIFNNVSTFTGKFILDMTSYTSVPTMQSGAFGIDYKPANGTFEIHVPASLYDTWKVATNWSTMASYLVPVS